jgi:hypothetical protein
MLEYIFKNKSTWRIWSLQLILKPQSSRKKLESDSVSIPPYILGNLCYMRVAQIA